MVDQIVPVQAAAAPTPTRIGSGSFPTPARRRRFFIILIALIIAAIGFALAHLFVGNPMDPGTDGYWRIAQLRGKNLVVIAIVAFCQAIATVSFQTATNNRILTPSIMGFEALYVAIQTTAVYLFGIAGIVSLQGTPQFLLQVAAMVGCAVVLFGWLLGGKYGDLQIMLLIGIVIGIGLRSVATFMQRLLTPSEFDVLAARLFGNISNADADYLPVAIPLVVIAGGLLWWRARQLNVMALGRDVSTTLGLNHRRATIQVLTLVSVLIAVSTALVGPMTFLGFLIATLAYQFADSFDHRHIFPMAVLIGFVILLGAYVIMKHVFYAQGVVSVIIEFVGGGVFLFVILRKGRL